jgi:hypothetical protein
MSFSWDREAAAHLAWRAGFGATPAELDRYLQMGLEATVDFFVNYAVAKVEDIALMWNQNMTQRSLCMDRFDDLVLAMTKDPAMLRWLDNRDNKKGNPNEDYAAPRRICVVLPNRCHEGD